MRTANIPSFAAAALFALALAAAGLAPAGEMIKWTDKEGNEHYSDSEADIPPEYRDKLEKKEVTNKPKPKEVRSSSFPWSDVTPGEGTPNNAEKLKKIVVPYRAFEGLSRRIIIDVRFNGYHTAPMLLDTGAPGVVLFQDLAQKLGLFEGDGGKLMVQAGGIGGTVPAMLTVVDKIEVGEAVSEFIPVTVTQSIGGAFEGLVGMDFMANYQMAIDNRRHVLVFQEMPESAERPGGHDETWWRLQFYQFAQLKAAWIGMAERLRRSGDRGGSGRLEFAERQQKEADRLLRRLDDYAAEQRVPMSWRQY